MEKILKKAVKYGLRDGVKVVCLVSEKEAIIKGNIYIQNDRIHAKTDSLRSGFIVLYDNKKYCKICN